MKLTIWAVLAAIAGGEGLFLAAVLLTKKENWFPNRIIASFLLILAFILFENVLWWTGLIVKMPAFKGLGFGFPLLFGPLMFLYYEVTFERKESNAKMLWHFLPFGLAVLLMMPFYLRFNENLSRLFSWVPSLSDYPWFPIVIFVQMIGYGVWVGWRFKKYFWEKEEMRYWHRCMLAAYWGIVMAYLLYRLMPYLGLSAPEWKYIIAFSIAFFIYLVAWLGYIEPDIFAGRRFKEAAMLVKYKKSSLSPEQSAELFFRISQMMENGMLYADGNLTLEGLSRKLNSQRHHVSQAINEQSGKSFPEYINGFRVALAQKLLLETSKQEMNIIEVAYEAGFNTKKAFNLAFKKQTGMTPSEFRNRDSINQ